MLSLGEKQTYLLPKQIEVKVFRIVGLITIEPIKESQFIGQVAHK